MKAILLSLCSTCGFIGFADDAVSPAFTFDARYQTSGLTPDAWVSYQAEGLSSRFSAATVTRAADANHNGIPDEWESQYNLVGVNVAADADPDNDGRTNIEEYNAGTNPTVAENYLASIAESPALLVDTWIASTAGGFGELVEVWGLSGLFVTDTAGRAPDADKDGLPDWWENLYGLNPNVADAYLDSDSDGRTNLEEYNAGTNPIVANDWAKSVSESNEAFETDTRVIYIGGNPTFDTTFAVIKVSNGFVCDTGGLYYDWDGDGIPNWWEARFSRTGSKTGLDASADDDSDGMSNYGEFVAYTNPTNSGSKFAISIVPITEASANIEPQSVVRRLTAGHWLSNGTGAAKFALKWQSAKGRIYSVYATANLSEGWPEEPMAEIVGTGDVLEYVPGQTAPAQFFKVSVRLAD